MALTFPTSSHYSSKRRLRKSTSRGRSAILCVLTIIVWMAVMYGALHTPAPFRGLPPDDGELAFTSLHRTEEEQEFLSNPQWLDQWHSSNRRSRAFFVDLPETKYAYCSIGKTGCTIHIGIIRRLHGEKHYEYLPAVHNNSANAPFLSYNRKDEEIKSKLLDDNFPKYTVVRNPMTRTLSAYRNKVESVQKNKKLRTPEEFHKWVFENFKDFNDDLPYNVLARWNIHWMPQYIQCGMNQARFFKIFKFEEPAGYIRYMKKIVPHDILDHGWGDERNLSLYDYHFVPRNRTGNVEDNFHKYYSRVDVFDRVAEIFKKDIKMFDYQDDVAEMRRKIIARSSQKTK